MEWTSPILRPTDFLLVAHSVEFKMKYVTVGAVKIAESYKITPAVITQPLSLHYVFLSYNIKPHFLEFVYLERQDFYTHAKFVVVAKLELWGMKRGGAWPSTSELLV